MVCSTNRCYVLAICSAVPGALCVQATYLYPLYLPLLFLDIEQPEPAKNTIPMCVGGDIYMCHACLVLHTLKAWRAASPCPDSIISLALLPIMVAPSSSSGSDLANASNSSVPFMASSSAYDPTTLLPLSKGGGRGGWGAGMIGWGSPGRGRRSMAAQGEGGGG